MCELCRVSFKGMGFATPWILSTPGSLKKYMIKAELLIKILHTSPPPTILKFLLALPCTKVWMKPCYASFLVFPNPVTYSVTS